MRNFSIFLTFLFALYLSFSVQPGFATGPLNSFFDPMRMTNPQGPISRHFQSYSPPPPDPSCCPPCSPLPPSVGSYSPPPSELPCCPLPDSPSPSVLSVCLPPPPAVCCCSCQSAPNGLPSGGGEGGGGQGATRSTGGRPRPVVLPIGDPHRSRANIWKAAVLTLKSPTVDHDTKVEVARGLVDDLASCYVETFVDGEWEGIEPLLAHLTGAADYDRAVRVVVRRVERIPFRHLLRRVVLESLHRRTGGHQGVDTAIVATYEAIHAHNTSPREVVPVRLQEIDVDTLGGAMASLDAALRRKALTVGCKLVVSDFPGDCRIPLHRRMVRCALPGWERDRVLHRIRYHYIEWLRLGYYFRPGDDVRSFLTSVLADPHCAFFHGSFQALFDYMFEEDRRYFRRTLDELSYVPRTLPEDQRQQQITLYTAYVWLQHQILTHMAEKMSISSDTLIHLAEYAVTATEEDKRQLQILYRFAKAWYSVGSSCRNVYVVPTPPTLRTWVGPVPPARGAAIPADG